MQCRARARNSLPFALLYPDLMNNFLPRCGDPGTSAPPRISSKNSNTVLRLANQKSSGPLPQRSRGRAYYELTKPGIAGFAMMTAGVACYVGSRGEVGFPVVLHTLFGTLLATAGALALNQYIERRVDAIMERTRTRPLPYGRLTPGQALGFGLLLVP